MSRIVIGPFSVELSPEWTLSTVILSRPLAEAPQEQGLVNASAIPFKANLVAMLEQVTSDQSIESYLVRQVDGLSQAGVVRYNASDPERLKLSDGLDGLITEQVIQGPSGEQVRQMQLMYIKDRVAYTLIASHLDGEPFEAMREEFRALLLSFRAN
jgi:hypothetical protein